MTPILVMFVGLRGATASTVAAGVTAMQLGALPPQAGTTDDEAFRTAQLPDLTSFRFGGWDLTEGTLAEAATTHGLLPRPVLDRVVDPLKLVEALPAIRAGLDIPIESDHVNVASVRTFGEAVNQVTDDIRHAAEAIDARTVVVVYTGSPNRRMDATMRSERLSSLEPRRLDENLASGLAYAYGALAAGAHFVDFTPCDTLESEPLHVAASTAGVQLAGRDGSTGQTILKQHIAHLLRMRGLRLNSWYSTNLIGNHDGYVLDLPGHDETKLSDKADMMAPLLGYSDFEHKVRIEYFRNHGDRKESWDAVDITGWGGAPISLRIGWRGHDSQLAAPVIIDVVRLIAAGAQNGRSGFQPQLGFFFKRPIRREGDSISKLYAELLDAYT